VFLKCTTGRTTSVCAALLLKLVLKHNRHMCGPLEITGCAPAPCSVLDARHVQAVGATQLLPPHLFVTRAQPLVLAAATAAASAQTLLFRHMPGATSDTGSLPAYVLVDPASMQADDRLASGTHLPIIHGHPAIQSSQHCAVKTAIYNRRARSDHHPQHLQRRLLCTTAHTRTTRQPLERTGTPLCLSS
jgi:hypothetical protein